MTTRSTHNWKTRSGVFDALNTRLIDFKYAIPELSSTFDSVNFDTVPANDYKKYSSSAFVSMFLDDYILERFWNNPEKYKERLCKCAAVMSPDFSILIGMPEPMIRWNIFRNRLIGYFWAGHGVNVVPSVSWAGRSSLRYAFDGISKHSSVCVSNIGCDKDGLKVFDKGIEKMINTIAPRLIYFQCQTRTVKNYESIDGVVFMRSFFDKKREQWAEDQVKY